MIETGTDGVKSELRLATLDALLGTGIDTVADTTHITSSLRKSTTSIGTRIEPKTASIKTVVGLSTNENFQVMGSDPGTIGLITNSKTLIGQKATVIDGA
ncbi:hypothetical protein V6N13_073229 [Hibiscus sabdariffa]|uniref:Uncharacterized protein n=1 Tax=Hibiscus sabdariffa TaxID=183260 RepID=A0ABR2E905_9ROSI